MVRMDSVNLIDQKDDDRPSNTLDHFSELDEVLAMIEQLNQIDYAGGHFEKAYEKFTDIAARYQEQPHLLDPHLSILIDKLLAIVRNEQNSEPLIHATFKYLYQLSKVRTYKALMKFLPHEVNDLDFVLKLLEQQSSSDADHWETRYFLLLWLSILVLNPFHMSRLDGFETNCTNSIEQSNHCTPTKMTKMERIFLICQNNCNSNDTCAGMAAFLASKYVVRVDLKDEYLPKFLLWIIEPNTKDITGMPIGQLSAIASILKHGKREDLLPHAGMLLKWCLTCNYKDGSDFLKQKYLIKIIQRLGLTFVKPRLAYWRYQRGSRSLTANLSSASNETVDFQGASIVENDDKDNGFEVPEEIEDIVEELLLALRIPSGDIRWSAAKGIGRVTNRLPKEFGDEVIGSVIEIFTPLEPHEGWHGACLAIAELAKRGLLLPYRLEEMVPILMQALVYDEMKGYMSVGQHIRDAACYMSWAFARAYEPCDLQPFVHRIASGLLVTTVFDREINCRRAASAAFQESVGRLGNFPHGIDILVAADFYSVGLRSNSFLNISYYIAQYEEYTEPLINHLIEKKINHWDTAIREITAKSLYKLTKHAPQYIAFEILPKLFNKTDTIDINLRHGSILTIGELTLALSELENEMALASSGTYLKDDVISLISDVTIKFQRRDLFRGLSGDIMYQACCDFIRNCCMAKIPVNSDCLESWQDIIDASLVKKSSHLRDQAILALQGLCESYYNQPSRIDTNNALIEKYCLGSANETEENIRMGYLSALGALPAFIIRPQLQEILDVLLKNCLTPTVQAKLLLNSGGLVDQQHNQSIQNPFVHKWAEARRDSIKALNCVIKTIGFDLNNCASISNAEYLDRIMGCLLKSLEEYTIDDRGDIGAWVREAAMTALFSLLTACPPELLKPEFVHTVLASLAQQAVETIDRTRALAGSLFCQLVHWTPTIPHIKHHNFLKIQFPEDNSKVLWFFADHTFPMFCSMLSLEEYSEKLILGLVVSIGKLSETLIKHSSTSLFQFLRTYVHHVPRICDQIVDVFKKHLLDNRVSHSLLNFLDLVISSGTINQVVLDENNTFSEEVFRLVKVEMKGQRNIYKLVSCANVLCHFIQIPTMCLRIFANIVVFLGQSHVHVRKSVATKFYEALVLHGDTTMISEENLEEILNILSETDWGIALVEIRKIRNNLCTLLGVKAPVSMANNANK